MDVFIHLAGFLGAWLLVAGPMLQGAIELRDEDLDRDAFTVDGVQKVPEPAPVSNWWWLLPPVAYYKNRKRRQAHHDAIFATLTQSQREQFVGFTNKATGWFTVAGGAFLIALKETWELTELFELALWVYIVVVVVLAVACVANTIARLSKSDELIHLDDPGYRDRMREQKRSEVDARRAQRKPGKLDDAGPQ
jgi:hypothetical protein